MENQNELQHVVIVRPNNSESSDELQHHGTKGMRWGIRRYQNKDGSLTPAGKRKRLGERTDKKVKSIETKTADKIKKLKETAKYQKKVDKAEAKAQAKLAKAEAKYGVKKKSDADDSKPKQKSIHEMTNDELREQITRIQLQQQLAALTPKQQTKGQQFVNTMLNDVIVPAAKTAGKDLATDYMKKVGKNLLGLNAKETKDTMSQLKKEAEKAGYQKTIAEAKKAMLEADSKELNYTKELQREAKKVKEAKEAEERAAKEAKKAEKESKKSKQQTEKDVEHSGTKEGKTDNSKGTKQNDSSNSSSKKSDDGPYEGTVEGEGTSRFSGWKSGPTVDATYREYSNKSSTSSEVTALSVPGQSYARSMYDTSIAGLLERKY